MSLFKIVFVALLMSALPGLSMADNPVAVDISHALVIKHEISKIYPDLVIKDINKTNISGIYEVTITSPDHDVFYVTSDAKYLFSGDLVDLKNKVSLTEKRKNELNKVSFNSLPLNNAIKEVHGKGQRKLILFSDPDCPFCKMIEEELPKLKNVTIYTFLFPLVSLHPESESHSRQVWCSANRLKVWNDFMRNKKALVGGGKCKNPIKENLKIGEKLGFSGTPTLVFPNGKVVSGAIRAEEMDKILNK